MIDMKKSKAIWILAFSGILLVLSCVVLGKALVSECSRLNGSYSMQKVLVSVKNQIDRQDKNSFSIEDIKRLRKELSIKDISYTAQSGLVTTSVSSGGTVLPVRLTGVDSMYPMFNSLLLSEGSFITEKQEEEGMMAVVIDDELAWELFKTVNATGKTLNICGGVFRVAGVVKKEDTLIGKLTDDGLADVYIPAAVMLELDTTARITALQIKMAGAGTMDTNEKAVSAALQQMGKSPSKYEIRDFNLRYALIRQVPLLFAFILGIASIRMLLVHIINLFKKLVALIRDGCRKDYFSNVIKFNRTEIRADLFETALAFAGIVLIWLGIRFELYIPAKYVPDELINISYYSDLIKSAIQGGMQNMGYVTPRPELIVDTVQGLLNLLFCISAVLGGLLLYMCFRELRTLNLDSNILMINFGLFFILALVILAAIAFAAGLPFMPDIKSILVVWAFIYINIFIEQRNCQSSDVAQSPR